MEFFLDTGIVDEIKEAVDWGLVDGVTTNPSLIAKSGRTQEDVIKEICSLVDGPISAEVISTDKSGMLKEAEQLAKIHGFRDQNKKTKFGLKLALMNFFKPSNKPKILEVSTNSETSSETLKSYFKFLSKSELQR